MLPRLSGNLDRRVISNRQDRRGIVATEAQRCDGSKRTAEAQGGIERGIRYPHHLRGADEVILIDFGKLAQSPCYAGIENAIRRKSQSTHVKGRGGCRICRNAG